MDYFSVARPEKNGGLSVSQLYGFVIMDRKIVGTKDSIPFMLNFCHANFETSIPNIMKSKVSPF